MEDRLASLSAEDFRRRLHEVFTVRLADDAELEAELVEVRDLSHDRQGQDRTPFSLLFRGPEDAALEQRIYRMENPELGELDLFLVTVGPDPEDGRMRYEAIFC